MNPLTILRTVFFVLLIATIATAKDKTPPTYQRGTISGWETRMDTNTSGGYDNTPVHTSTRHTKVYELRSAGLAYKMTIAVPSRQENSWQGRPWSIEWMTKDSTFAVMTARNTNAKLRGPKP
jgi:hypothetical protein